MEKKQSPDKNASGSNDLSSSSISRVGAVLAAIGTLFGEGCAGGPQRHNHMPPTPPVPHVAPLNDFSHVVEAASHLKMENLTYFDSSGHYRSHFRETRELSLRDSVTTSQGISPDWDAAIKEKGALLKFKMSSFETWRAERITELKRRYQNREELTSPGSGIVFDINGEVAKTFPRGGTLHAEKLNDTKVESLLDWMKQR